MKTATWQVNRPGLIKLYRQALAEGRSMAEVDEKIQKKLHRLLVSEQVSLAADEQTVKKEQKSLPTLIRWGANLVPVALIVAGFLLLGSAVVPIIASSVKSWLNPALADLIAPIPPEKVLGVTPLVIAQAEELPSAAQVLRAGPMVVEGELDYTNLSNWFDETALAELKTKTSLLSEQTGEYILDIPQLKITNAVVKIGGTDLEKSLIQYPGTSLPGKPGSPVVFGHSVLRQFYNPKETNPRRYNSLFSTIMTMQKGDKFQVTYNQVTYTYMVQSKQEVKPTDTYILAQDYNQHQFKLVTCVPEGTFLRRGVVTAQLVKE